MHVRAGLDKNENPTVCIRHFAFLLWISWSSIWSGLHSCPGLVLLVPYTGKSGWASSAFHGTGVSQLFCVSVIPVALL